MNSVTSAFLGFIFTVLLFLLCFFLVVGVKFVFLSVKAYVKKPSPTVSERPSERPTEEKPKPKPKKPRLKSIRIDPDEIDRIYVRK